MGLRFLIYVRARVRDSSKEKMLGEEPLVLRVSFLMGVMRVDELWGDEIFLGRRGVMKKG